MLERQECAAIDAATRSSASAARRRPRSAGLSPSAGPGTAVRGLPL